MAATSTGGLLAAHESRYHLRVDGFADNAFQVECFRTVDFALSSCPSVNITARCTTISDAGSVVGRTGALKIKSASGGENCVSGEVQSIRMLGERDQAWLITLESPLGRLTRQQHSRVFREKTVVDIVSAVLVGAGFPKSAFRFSCNSRYPSRDYVVQYDETDWDFVQRLLTREGIFHASVIENGVPAVLFHDDVDALREELGRVRLQYRPNSGQHRVFECVHALEAVDSISPDQITLRDYNPDSPKDNLDVTIGDQGSGGSQELWGLHYSDVADGERLARIRQEALDGCRARYLAACDSPLLRPGMQLCLEAPDGEETDWLVLAVQIEGDQSTALAHGRDRGGAGLNSQLVLQPAAAPYRHDGLPTRQPVLGHFSAFIEKPHGEYAHLDQQGRYRLRMAFDGGDAAAADASHPVRMMQPYGGDNHGMHFPLHAGTEVLVGCMNGDPDRPLILGAVSNADAPTPVTSTNSTQHIVRTWGQNELLMEDRSGEERVELFTGHRKNRLCLDARADMHCVTLESQEGDMELLAGGAMNEEIGGARTVEVKGDEERVIGNDSRLMTREGGIVQHAHTDLECRADANLRMEAERGDVELIAGEALIANAGEGLSVQVDRGDARLLVQQGDMHCDLHGGLTLRGSGNAPLSIGQSGGGLEVEADGGLIIQGPTVRISGGTVVIDGDSISGN